MTMTSTGPQAVRADLPLRAAAIAMFALALAAPVIGAWLAFGEIIVDDDTHYYTIIARHIAETGRSTFDGQSLTNGYHPLWQWLLALQFKLIGPSAVVTLVLELAMLCGALWIVLHLSGVSSIAGTALIVVGFLAGLHSMTLRGMEPSLLIGCFAVLVLLIVRQREGSLGGSADRDGMIVGIAAAATIGARLDAAVFVLPLVWLSLAGRVRWTALAVLAGGGTVFAAYNAIVFGTILPVSASIKSLGGLQINWLLLDQIGIMYGTYTAGYVLAGLACILAARIEAPGSWQRALLNAIALGMALHAAKLLFGSSWRIWDWYFYPTALAAIALLATQTRRVVALLDSRKLAPVAALLVASNAALMIYTSTRWAYAGRDYTNFRFVNREAAERLAPILAGAPVAFGDRAGSFAAAYRGPVVQTEGLVNDKAWFDALTRGEDVHGLLCRRGIKFVADFAPDLGSYTTHEVETLRERLTTFKAPRISVEKRNEVGRFSNLEMFDPPPLVGGGNAYLYVWRLGC